MNLPFRVHLSRRHDDQLDRIEHNQYDIMRGLDRMAANEAAFDAALADFVTTLDSALAAIKEKLDSLDVPQVDFTDELATLDAAKTRLDEFVQQNTGTGSSTPEESAGTDTGTEGQPV